MTLPQNPMVRRWHTCPKCLNSKDEGLVLCWPCHRTEKRQNDGGYSVETEAKIALAEKKLAYIANRLTRLAKLMKGGVT